ncbi:NADPH:quinone oxidoreductase family protein [Simiduia agarivorans]|uniref:Zinc-containing alcohol dehydrogenase superfamily protein n=1 Tax=Simiduia agarivorans (strain DSM 21679 / JCM 13881 / BCRC 17597 / SA1) TaxID=1117647 RepID=K4KIB8_SIMAS|nr:NADPH:quinone oxidoreductase family protein [Simiduia agarivorans]AFU98899.1 Zinc-containing alcohol dehydrogenase superfamily protein [Simiduia agarivorans SA1 = DSM 21679]
MKAIVCNAFGEPLTLEQRPDLKAGPGQVVINIEAAGVNFPDGLLVAGLYQFKPPLPFVPGTEVAGTIAEVGEGVKHLTPGQRVVSVNMLDGYASQMLTYPNLVMPLPDGIPVDEAAGLITAHATAHHGLKQRANLKAGETLLVTGAAGGTGLAAVQIGKAMGARVIACCSTTEKLALAREHGADELINYTEENLKDAIKRLTDGKGVDVVYDTVGGDNFEICARSMAWNGRLLVVGFASGDIPKLAVNLTLVKGFSVVGVFWGTFTQKEPKVFASNMAELFQWYLEGKVKVVIHASLPLEQAEQALKIVADRQVMGKVILKP